MSSGPHKTAEGTQSQAAATEGVARSRETCFVPNAFSGSTQPPPGTLHMGSGEGAEGEPSSSSLVLSGCKRLQIGRLQLHANSPTDTSTPGLTQRKPGPLDHPPPQRNVPMTPVNRSGVQSASATRRAQVPRTLWPQVTG